MADDANKDVTDEEKIRRQKEEHYAIYSDYSRTLRAWLVAYGVGGPVLILTQEAIASRITASGSARCIICLFLTGVAAQVVIALINKWVNWCLYSGADESDRPSPRIYALAERISREVRIDIMLDLLSIITIGWATVCVFLVFVGS